jgi:effector-binding domain-containing protein
MSFAAPASLTDMNAHMQIEPTIVERPAQPYVAVRGLVTMETIGEVADRFPELFGWLDAHGVTPVGAPFLKYNVIDMDRQLEIEAGAPVPADIEGEGDIIAGVLPAGRYATITHVGHPDRLIDVTAALLAWAADRDLTWDMTETDHRERWGCRLEVYRTDPSVQPDMSKWETDLVFRLTG